MNYKNNKYRKALIAILLAIITVSVTGMSFAYFASTINTEAKLNGTVNSEAVPSFKTIMVQDLAFNISANSMDKVNASTDGKKS